MPLAVNHANGSNDDASVKRSRQSVDGLKGMWNMGFKETAGRASARARIAPFILINFAFFLFPRQKSLAITEVPAEPESIIYFMFVGNLSER